MWFSDAAHHLLEENIYLHTVKIGMPSNSVHFESSTHCLRQMRVEACVVLVCVKCVKWLALRICMCGCFCNPCLFVRVNVACWAHGWRAGCMTGFTENFLVEGFFFFFLNVFVCHEPTVQHVSLFHCVFYFNSLKRFRKCITYAIHTGTVLNTSLWWTWAIMNYEYIYIYIIIIIKIK